MKRNEWNSSFTKSILGKHVNPHMTMWWWLNITASVLLIWPVCTQASEQSVETWWTVGSVLTWRATCSEPWGKHRLRASEKVRSEAPQIIPVLLGVSGRSLCSSGPGPSAALALTSNPHTQMDDFEWASKKAAGRTSVAWGAFCLWLPRRLTLSHDLGSLSWKPEAAPLGSTAQNIPSRAAGW